MLYQERRSSASAAPHESPRPIFVGGESPTDRLAGTGCSVSIKIVASRRDPEGLGRPNDLHPAYRAETETFLPEPGLPQSWPDTILKPPTDGSPHLISPLSSTPPSELRFRRCDSFVTRCRGSLACPKHLGFPLRVVECAGITDWRQSAPIGGGDGPIRT